MPKCCSIDFSLCPTVALQGLHMSEGPAEVLRFSSLRFGINTTSLLLLFKLEVILRTKKQTGISLIK